MLHVQQRSSGLVVLCSIDRPAKRNAVDQATLDALTGAVDDAVRTGARALVLAGRNGVFSAGADLGGVEDVAFIDALRRALLRLAEAPLVTLAAVDGPALGAGTQLAAFCDLRTATPESVFGIPAAKLGIAVDQSTIARVVELCGGGAARAMLLAAETIDGVAAHTLGFVTRLGGVATALEWADSIAQLAPLTIVAHKLALTAIRTHMNGSDDEVAASVMRRAWESEDLQEGRAAFLARRRPVFQGR